VRMLVCCENVMVCCEIENPNPCSSRPIDDVPRALKFAFFGNLNTRTPISQGRTCVHNVIGVENSQNNNRILERRMTLFQIDLRHCVMTLHAKTTSRTQANYQGRGIKLQY